MVKAAKTTKRITSKKKNIKEPTWYEKFKFISSWRVNAASDSFIEKLIEEMFTYFENPKNISLMKFLSSKGIIFDVFNDWTKSHKNLKEAYTMVMQEIGTRREELATRKEHNCNPQTLHYTMRHYNPMWRKSFDQESALKLKQSEKGSNEVKVVVIEKFAEEDK